MESFPQGQIYTIAPKQYVVRGYDYFLQGRLINFEWNDDCSILTAHVRGNSLYAVTISAKEQEGLDLHCTCPAWTSHSNCKHVICSLMTIKSLLQPDTFRTHRHAEGDRPALMKQLRNEAPQTDKTLTKAINELPHSRVTGHRETEGCFHADVESRGIQSIPSLEYSIVIEKDSDISNIYLVSNGKRINNYSPNVPHELRNLTAYSYYPTYSRPRELAGIIQKIANKYPIILKLKDGETVITFNQDECIVCTEFDTQHDSVQASKVCVSKEKTLRDTAISGDFAFDNEAKTFSLIKDKKGWKLWNDAVELLYESDSYDDLPDNNDTSFVIPIRLFQKMQIVYPTSEGDKPHNILLKSEGQEARVQSAIAKYRLTITSDAMEELFTMTAE